MGNPSSVRDFSPSLPGFPQPSPPIPWEHSPTCAIGMQALVPGSGLGSKLGSDRHQLVLFGQIYFVCWASVFSSLK